VVVSRRVLLVDARIRSTVGSHSTVGQAVPGRYRYSTVDRSCFVITALQQASPLRTTFAPDFFPRSGKDGLLIPALGAARLTGRAVGLAAGFHH
jgi:hypothetical protein